MKTKTRKAFIWIAAALLLAGMISACKEEEGILGIVKEEKQGGVGENGGGGASYSVTIGTLENGSVVASPDSAKAETPITLTVSPAENYSLAGLTVSKNGGGTVDVSGSGPYTFTMPAADVTVTAGFRQSSDGDNGTLYSVTIGQLTNGSVSAGLYNATAETTVTLTVNPAEGCRLKANSLTVTKADSSPVSVSVSGSGPYTFTMPAENVEVSAEFEPIPFSGSSTAAGDSVIDLIKAAAGGASLTLTLAAANEEDVTLTNGTDLLETGLVLKHEGQETDTSPASVTIDGGGRVVDLTGSATGSPLITVGDGVTLTLKNITLKGLSNTDNDSNDNNAPLVKVVAGGALVLETGAVIEKNDVKTNSSIHGLGVHITGTGATFTMYDGSEVRNNIGYIWNGGAAGGGVYVDNGGTFNMEGGSVTGNTARRGAVAASGTGIVNLRGGSISGNTGKYGGGVSAGINGNYGGGIVNMYGGSVSGNTGNDIWIFTGEFRMYGGYSEHLTNENLFTIEGPITWNGAVSGNVTFSGNVAGSGTMNVTGTVYTKGYTYSGLVIEATGGINTTS